VIDIRAGGASDVGRVRTKNQDAWLVHEHVYAVADGMGGHQGGEVAARLAVEVLQRETDELTAQTLVAAARTANATIHDQSERRPDLRGMGTTLCAMALVADEDGDDELAVINVGDSRLYLWRDGDLVQITRDHSLVEDMRASGQITEAEAAVHPHRNIVTRALGISPNVEVDEFIIVPRTGDRYVICSDGLFNEVSSEKIGATLRRLADPRDAASELIRQANEGGGRDNITCVVVDIVDDDGRAERAAAAGIDAIRSRPRRPDVAGITTAIVDDDPGPVAGDGGAGAPPLEKSGRKAKAKAKAKAPAEEPRVRLRRATWRTGGFVLLVLIVLAAAAGAVGWYSRGTYYVGLGDKGEVTVYKGRPSPVLWFHPTVEQKTGIAKAQVPQLALDAVSKGKEVSSMAAAQDYLTQLRSQICSNLRNGATLPPADPSAPTTTIPPVCADLATKLHPASTTTTANPPATTKVPATTAPPTTRR
jgi:protein phosphatase